MPELGLASGPVCGAAVFVALTGGRLPLAGPGAWTRALAVRWLSLTVAAGVEEIVWRGLALARLATALGPALALAATSVGFALWHRHGLGRRCAVHLITGLAFGAAFLIGGLAAAVIAHAIYNVLVDWAVQAERRRTW